MTSIKFLQGKVTGYISKILILTLVFFIYNFGIHFVFATNLSACGEIAVSGTYVMTNNLGTPGVTCLTITTSGVVIDGALQYSVLGNIVGNVLNYSLINLPPAPQGILADFSYNNVAGDGNWGNTANWSTLALPTSVDNVYVSGNISMPSNTFSPNNAVNTVSTSGANISNTWSGSYSFSFWLKTSSTATQRLMYGSNNGRGLFIDTTCTRLAYSADAYINSTYGRWTIPATTCDGNWFHLVITKANNSSAPKAYINGVLLSYTGLGTWTDTNVFPMLYFVDGWQMTTSWIGSIDEVILYSGKELSATEVATLYNGGLPVEQTNMTNVWAYWKFNESANRIAYDSSGNGRNLTFCTSYCGALTWGAGISTAARKTDVASIQQLNMTAGTNNIYISTTNGANLSGTATNSGTIFGNTILNGDEPTLSASGTVTSDTAKTKSLHFNGKNTYATANDPAITGNALTMSAWVRVGSYTGDDKMIFGLNRTANPCSVSPYTPYLFRAVSASGGGVEFGLSTNDGARTYITASSSYAPLNTWAHLTAVYDGANMYLYVNGVQRATVAKTGNVSVGAGGKISFGDLTCSSSHYWFWGNISDAALWNVALNSDQVTSLYNSAPDKIGISPTSYWKFIEGTGSTAADSIGGRTATIYNGFWSSFLPPFKYLDNASITRIYTTDTATTRDFTQNSGRWIIESDGADIDLTSATYAVSTTTYQSNKNVFRAKNGATFTENPSINGGAHVVPKIVINSPVAGTNLSWSPNIDWDGADTCEYKWGSGGSYSAVNCALNGSDIPKPAAFATTTLYIKGAFEDTSYAEKTSPEFMYDNVSPAPTNCSVPMDEPTRQYYYLESDVIGDCTATANITLKGASTTEAVGYTINGQLIASATSTTNGFNLVLENITVTGTTTASGSGAGNRGGNISMTDSALGNVVTNGGSVSLADSSASAITTSSDTTGVYAGSITIENSTTSNLTSNSLDSGKDGGDITITGSNIGNAVTNGGTISLINSIASLLASNSNSGGILGGNITVDVSTTTDIYANGGDITVTDSSIGLVDSTSETSGIAGGDITITDPTSTVASITTNGGSVTLTNTTVVGAINATGNSGLSTVAIIDITNSTTSNITANGGTGGTGVGGNGAAVTITNSSVGLVETNGGSSGKRGGAVSITDSTTSNITTNGGVITVENSVTSQLASNSNSGGILGGNITVDVSTTTDIYANGGDITVTDSSIGLVDSTSETSGIAGGDITITDPTSTVASITTNGGSVTLTNTTVVGAINANGNTGGISAGEISISNSTTTAIYANGGTNSSGNGGHGALITIATSTTGLIEASGADADGDGGDGGVINITYSIGTSATSTPITANGGDSLSCGDGGDSGIITITDSSYGTVTAEPGVGNNSGCSGSTKTSGTKTAVVTVGQGHPSTIRPPSPTPTPTPTNQNAIGGGINQFFRQGINQLDFTPIQQFNLFGNDFKENFKPMEAGVTRLPRVFTDFKGVNDLILDEMPVNIFPSLKMFVFEEMPKKLEELFPNATNLLAAAGISRTQELASLFRNPKLLTDIQNPEKYGLFKVYSGDILVNTYVAYEQAIDNLAQLIKVNPSQIIYIGTYTKGAISDESKIPFIIFQGQKKFMTPTFDKYYAASIIAPNLEGRYLIETSSNVQILLDVLPQNGGVEQKKPWGVFNRLWKLFH